MRSRVDYVLNCNRENRFDIVLSEKRKHESLIISAKTEKDISDFLQISITEEGRTSTGILQFVYPKIRLEDHEVDKCGTCGSTFSLFLRKHHCRCCGRIFCGSCANDQVKIPKLFSNEKDIQRVCRYCFRMIKVYRMYEKYIKYLRIMNFKIPIVFRLRSVMKEAVEFYINEFRSIRYYRSIEKISLRHVDMLKVNKSFLAGHSGWEHILERLGIKLDSEKVYPCETLGCSCKVLPVITIKVPVTNPDIYDLVDHIKGGTIPLIPIYGPFGVIMKVTKVEAVASTSKPKIYNYVDERNIDRKFLFKFENVKNDFYATNLIKFLYDIVKQELELKSDLVTYRVIPIDMTSGFVEIVPNAKTISEILTKGTISNYLYHNKEVVSNNISNNYMMSLAFWTVMSYVIGIGDRHLDNIMINDDGCLFHVDYGYILGQDKSYCVRLDSDMVEGLGGISYLPVFKTHTLKMFMVVREYYNLISKIVSNVSNNDDFIYKRLMVGYTDDEIKYNFLKVIDDSYNMFRVSDIVHSTVKKIWY